MTPPPHCRQHPCEWCVFPALQEATSKGLRRTRSAEGVPVGSPRRPPPKPPTPTIPEGGMLADPEEQPQEAASTQGSARHSQAEEETAGAACMLATILHKQYAPQAARPAGARTTLWPAFVHDWHRRMSQIGSACVQSPLVPQQTTSAYLASTSMAAVPVLPRPCQQGIGCMHAGTSGSHKRAQVMCCCRCSDPAGRWVEEL